MFSCLSENSSVAAFSSLAGLFRDPRGMQFRTVLEPAIYGGPHESQYASLNSTWRNPATGIIHGWSPRGNPDSWLQTWALRLDWLRHVDG